MYEYCLSIICCLLLGIGVDLLNANSFSIYQDIGMLVIMLSAGIVVGAIAHYSYHI